MTNRDKLKILEINRQDIQRNIEYARRFLKDFELTNLNETNADVQLSLQLNKSLAEFYSHADYNACIHISSMALEKYGATGDPYFVITHLNILGGAYSILKQYQEAESYFSKAIELARYEPSYAHLLVNIYQQITENCLQQEGAWDKALEYTDKSLELLDDYPKPLLLYRVFLQRGNIYFKMGRYEIALDYYDKALSGFAEDYELFLMATTYIAIGRCHLKDNELGLAKMNLLEGLKLGEKAGHPENTVWNNIYLAEVYLKENNIKEASNHANVARHIAESISSAELMAEADKMLMSTSVNA